MALPTLLDIAVANGCDAVVGLIDESRRAHPELILGAARTIKGRMYKTLVRIAAATVAFRNANEGTAVARGTHENRLVETFILSPPMEIDKAVADSFEDGPEAFMALESGAVMEGAFATLCSQFYYGQGTGGDSKGHPGLIDSIHADLVVDAGGTTGDTASSVWAVRWGPKNVQWVWGQNGQLELADVTEVRLTDGSSNPYTGYHTELLAYPGVQVGSKFSIGRIKKITADSAKTLTDDMISDLLSKFPAGYAPELLLMSRRSRKQLQQSRTATNATGAPAPFPVEAFGVPIQTTDAILDTEALTL